MRVAMGEVVDITSDLTTHNLSLSQKISVIFQTLISDSVFLGKQKRLEEERAIKERNELFDVLKDGLLASISYHLHENKTLSELNQVAVEVQLAINRKHKEILIAVMESHEFNIYDWHYVQLDADIINSFGDDIPIIISFKQKEV